MSQTSTYALQGRLKTIHIIAVILAIALGANARAGGLVYTEQQGLLFYYPANEKTIAARLLAQLPDMRAFLTHHGLPITTPLHVVLDGDRDLPEPKVQMFPHREIRIPLRAPGVFEEGFREADPWAYFLFKGLCLQGIYATRSGIPATLHKVFGEVVSPNLILPPWLEQGIGSLLYARYREQPLLDPLEAAIFALSPVPDVDDISHHPQVWPGYWGYRIFGKPFVQWLQQHYGWEKILAFIRLHGHGVVPVELDLKAKKVFGKTGIALWHDFQIQRQPHGTETDPGFLIGGYWANPFVYWNQSGIYPGVLKVRHRGRYGWVDAQKQLWISEFNARGHSQIVQYTTVTRSPINRPHMWDPGPGGVAVTRVGSQPRLVMVAMQRPTQGKPPPEYITLPPVPGAIQLSGPVADENGRIAVAANIGANWDIWVYDRQWRRITRSPAIEVDPWWEEGHLIFTSNASGIFQIHDHMMRPITRCPGGGLYPRDGKYLCLTPGGWQPQDVRLSEATAAGLPETTGPETQSAQEATPDARPYTPWKSIWPNYMVPDIFLDITDLQLGVSTRGQDVKGEHLMDAGVRYSAEDDYLSLRAGAEIKNLGTRFTRYPLSYESALSERVAESRNEIKLYYLPFRNSEISLNWRNYEPLEFSGSTDEEFWGGLHVRRNLANFNLWGNLDIFDDNSQSLYGGVRYLFGREIYATLHLMGGKTWGRVTPGHNTFRVGGNIAEGYFTQRPSRLFPLRGFDSNILDAPEVVSSGVELFWPLANLQSGYKTLPLFLHRFKLGTFVDAGGAADHLAMGDLLVGAGIEMIISMEIAWGNLSALRIGVAWPLEQPDYLDESGPVFLFQLGLPL